MNADYNMFADNYLNWLKDNIESQSLEGGVIKVTLPYLDKDNDEIELYIVPEKDGRYRITDDGATLSNLELSGFEFNSTRRKDIFNHVVNSFGVEYDETNDSLQVYCSIEEMPVKKHMLAQCMVKVSDMFYLTRANVQNVFLDDVKAFLDMNSVRYIADLILTGKSKLVTHYDFAIPKSSERPERIIQVINSFDSVIAKTTMFSWTDTHEMRSPDAQLLAIINDTNKRPSGAAITALKEYGIIPIIWSEKESHKSDFIA